MIEVPLRSRDGSTRAAALIDSSDAALVLPHRWGIHTTPGEVRYARAYCNDLRNTLMHTLIMGVVGIDHRNRDGLDNRRENLRLATHAQNMANRGSWKRDGLPKGVYRNPKSATYIARMTVNRKPIYLGSFGTPGEAAAAYAAAAREAWGEFALTDA